MFVQWIGGTSQFSMGKYFSKFAKDEVLVDFLAKLHWAGEIQGVFPIVLKFELGKSSPMRLGLKRYIAFPSPTLVLVRLQ